MQRFFALLARLPLGFLQSLGTLFGSLTFRLSRETREQAEANLRQAGLFDERLYRSVGRNAGRQAMESLWVWYRKPEEVMTQVRVDPECECLIRTAVESGRPIVFMTPHVGCFEVLPVWFAHTFYRESGRNISILYRPPKFDVLRRLVGEARQAPGIVACPTTLAGVKEVIRNLRAGHTFGALPDQVPSHGEGVWAPFFGKPAYTMTLPVRVARQFDAIRIFAWGVREPHGWHIHGKEWSEPLTGDLEKDAASGNYNPVALRYGLSGGKWTEESRRAFAKTLDHSVHMIATAFELWDFGCWHTLLEDTMYSGLFQVGHAVLNGTFRRKPNQKERSKSKDVEETR